MEDTHNLLNDLGLPVPRQELAYSEQEAVRAARRIGYPVVVKPLDANHGRGVSINLNGAPGFRMHVAPSEGRPRDVAGPVMDMLFPPGTPTRIPIAAITGTNGKATTARMVAHILKNAGHTVGMTSTDGVYIDGQFTVKGDMTGPTAAQMVLRDPSVSTRPSRNPRPRPSGRRPRTTRRPRPGPSSSKTSASSTTNAASASPAKPKTGFIMRVTGYRFIRLQVCLSGSGQETCNLKPSAARQPATRNRQHCIRGRL